MGVKLLLFEGSPLMFLVSILVTTVARVPKFDFTFGVSMEIASLNYFFAEDYVFVRLPALFLVGLVIRRFIIADCGYILDCFEPI